jgi:hypothetical protein
MKILFLDIDGVMVLDPHKVKDPGLYGHDPFYKPSVDALNHIISSTNCETVISSGWRRFLILSKSKKYFNGIVFKKSQLALLRIMTEMKNNSLQERKLRC